MIDLHIHVLPGVDDGARDLAESLAMLRLAVEDGTRVVCATPHAHGPDYDVASAAAAEALGRLKAAAGEAAIDVDLRLASEVWYRPDLADLAKANRLAAFSTGSRRYVLVEFPPTHVPPEAEEALFRLRLEGVTPVIAHPERNPTFWADPSRMQRFREQGALSQVTAGSFTGLFRRESRDCAMALLSMRAIDLVASDAHRSDRRPPGLSEAARLIAKKAGPEEADRLTSGVPGAILAGSPAPGVLS